MNYTYPNIYPNLNHYAFVNGIEGAKSFQVSPNQTMLLMDSDSPIVFKKTTNNIGQSTIEYFKLVQIKESEAREIITPQVNNGGEYVLKSDFDELNKKLDDLLSKIGSEKEVKK